MQRIYAHVLLSIIFMSIMLFPHASIALTVENTDVSIETIPQQPAPYSTATIQLGSYATDLNKAMIEWSINNKQVLTGTGKTSYSLKTDGPNTSTVVNVLITLDDGMQIKKQMILSPSEIDMLWQAVDSYTPPFYKGKALLPAEGTVKVVVFPNVTNIPSASNKQLVYTWKRNFNSEQSASGYGKNSYTFSNSSLNNKEHIGVTVSSVSGSYNATGVLDVPVSSPKLLFYKRSLNTGILYGQALDKEISLPSSDEEITIVAEPYFMTDIDRNLAYEWKINTNSIATPKNPRELTVRPSSRGGYATIGLSIENASKLFQSIQNLIRINL